MKKTSFSPLPTFVKTERQSLSPKKISPISLISLIRLIGLILLGTAAAFFLLREPPTARALDWPKAMSGFAKRKQLTLVNNSGATLNSGATYQLSLNTSTLNPSVRPDCADVRVVYHSSATTASELARAYALAQSASTCRDSTATTLTFPLQAALTNGSSVSDYYLYWGSPGASYSASTALSAYNMGSSTATFAAPFNGTTTALAAGSGTPTTASGAIRYSGGKSALGFDGVNDVVNSGSDSSLDDLHDNAFTAEAWMKPDSAGSTSGGTGTLIQKGADGWGIQFLNGTNFYGKVFCATTDSSVSISISGNITYGQWHHVALTFDDAGDRKVRLYINGTLVGTGSACVGNVVSDASQSLGVGSHIPYSARYFDGLIDEIRISNSIRYTAAFTPQTSPFIRDSNTKLLLHFDENGTMPTGNYAYDDSGNNNTGTITGAKYVGGLIGVDTTITDSAIPPSSSFIPAQAGIQASGSYASHQGVFIEEGTTNKITNPSFENSTAYGTNWSASDGTENYGINATPTFTASMAKRNSAGPFAAGPIIQGNWDATSGDRLTYSRGNQISGGFYNNIDVNQGSVVFWITPEWNGNDNKVHDLWKAVADSLEIYTSASQLHFMAGGSSKKASVDISSWTAGTTYLVTARWDKNTLDGTNYVSLSVGDTHSFGATSTHGLTSPDSTLDIGSYGGVLYPANAIIEGLTIYRRPLYDPGSADPVIPASGINAGNGDEIAKIYDSDENNGNGITSQDPTLVTGSWDVVFALPTNATTGSLSTGTGEAWSHPHSSNLLPGNSNKGGFMMDGTYATDGWADEGTPTAVAALATAEKIYAGGYKVTSDAANEGIYDEIAVTAGNDYVIRAVAHSDGTSIPKVIITGADDVAITSLTGTATSTRTAPDVLLFTFEADATENIKVKLVNSDATAAHITYWHQVEVLANLVDNPSLETWQGTTPNIPTSWNNYSSFPLASDEIAQEIGDKHSGASSAKFISAEIYEGIQSNNLSITANKFYSSGGFAKATTNSLQINDEGTLQSTNAINTSLTYSDSSWVHKAAVYRGYTTVDRKWLRSINNSSTGYFDDIYKFLLSDVSLTVTPATEPNSTETSGLRVDGKDALTQTATALSSTAGEISFKITPRHSYANAALFGNTSPVIAAWYGDANDYIKLVRFSSTVLRVESQFNGTAVNSDTSVAPTLDAGTTYTIKITYAAGGTQKLYIDSVEKASASVGAAVAFSTVPATTYFGSDNSSANQYDLTVAAATPTAISPAANTTAPYYKFGSKSVKLDGTSTDATNYLTSIAGAATSHTLSAYVYNGTSGAVGGTVDGTVATLVFKGAAVSTVYTDAGSGWWRLTYSGTSQVAAANYGVHVQTGKIIYVDGVQLEEKAYATTYADGSLGTGYAWTGTAHESTSTRTGEALAYNSTSNLNASAGTVSFWAKTTANSWTNGDRRVFNRCNWNDTNCLVFITAAGGAISFSVNDTSLHKAQGTVNTGEGRWNHIVGTWSTTSGEVKLYLNNNTPSTATGLTSWTPPATIYLGDGTASNTGDLTFSDLRIYSSALTSAQVGDLYNAGLASHSEATTVQTQFGDGEPPVAAWSFDEGTGTTAYNNSSNSSYLSNPSYLNGTISGATWQAEDLCLSGKCLKFDGTDDLTTISGVSASNPLSVNTIGFWIKPTSVTSSGLINLTSGAYLTVASGVLSATGLTSPIYYINGRATTTPTLTLNQWTHVEVTTSTAVTADTITIGKANSLWTTGFLDEVRLYSYARSAAQVKADYNSRGALKGTAAAVGNGRDRSLQNESGAPSQGLVGYWKLDEASSPAIDSSGNSNSGTWNGTAAATTGKFGNAINFDGNSDYIKVNTSSSLDVGNKITVAFWVNVTSNANSPVLIGGDIYSSGWEIQTDPSYQMLFYITHNNSNIYKSGALSSGWHHMAITFDNSESYAKYYLDGAQQTVTQAQDRKGVSLPTGRNVYIGSRGGTSNYLSGSMDDLRIYSRALSPAEVRALYNFAPGPVAHWSFNEGSGTTVADDSGNSNTGTFSGTGQHWTTGKYGKAGKFNGTDDYVSLATPTDLDIAAPGSVSTWVKTNSDTGQTIYSVTDKDNPQSLWVILVGNGSTTYLTDELITVARYTGAGVNTYTLGYTTSTRTELINNAWHHIEVIADGSAVKIYLDGVQKTVTVGNGSNTGAFADVSNVDTADIGSTRYGGSARGGYFSGLIDDVRIYNYARSAKQITEDMTTGLAVTAGGGKASVIASGTKQSAPLAWYKFSEGYGTTANNSGSAGSPLNGSLTNMSSPATATSGWTNSGKMGKGLNFVTDDYVMVADNSALSFGDGTTDQPFSASAWIKMTDATNFVIVSKRSTSSNREYTIYTDASDYLRIYFYDNSVPSWIGITSNSTLTSYQNQWIHLITTYDGSKSSSGIKVYLNAKLLPSASNSSGSYTAMENLSASLGIGFSDESSGYYTNGSIDDVKIYNFALTEDEVRLDYNQGSALVLGSVSTDPSSPSTPLNSLSASYCVPGGADLCPPPVAEWNFNEGTGTSANDSSGNANTGTFTNGPTWTTGKQGKAVRFDGTNDYVSVSTLTIPTTGTMELWWKPQKAITSAQPIFRVIGAGGITYDLYPYDNKIYCGWFKTGNDDRIVWTATEISQNNWYHLALSWTNGGTTTLYVNGINKATTSDLDATWDTATSISYFGWDSILAAFAQMSIDQVRVYNYARTPAQVAWDYNNGGPVGWWRMDDCQGTTALDHSGNKNNGTISLGASPAAGTCSDGTGTTAWSAGASGKYNASLKFDGSDDYVSIGDTELSNTDQISFGAWVKPADLTTAGTVVGKNGYDSSVGGYTLQINWGGNGAILYDVDDASMGGIIVTNRLTASTWTHLFVTYDGTNAKLYQDGKLINTTARSGNIPNHSKNLQIGKQDVASYPRPFSGLIDDVSVFNYALTPTQVKLLYNQDSSVRFGPREGNP